MVETEKRRIETEFSQYFITNKNSIESAFDTLNKQSYQFLTNHYVISFVTSTYVDQSDTMMRVQEMMSNAITVIDHLEAVEIYSFYNDYVFSTRSSAYLGDLLYTPWYDEYNRTGQTNFMIPVKTDVNSTKYEEVCVSFGLYRNNRLCAMVLLYMDPAKVLSVTNDKDEFIIVNSDESILYSGDRTSIGKSAKEVLSKDLLELYNGKNNKFSDGNDAYFKSPFFNDTLMLIYESKGQDKKTGWINWILVVLVFVFMLILIPFPLALYISKQFYSPIAKIISYLSKEDGEYNLFGGNDKLDELTYIEQNIFDILSSNEELKEDLSFKAEQLKTAQATALQMQFNPHFLFNTLNLVSMKAIHLTKSENEISKIISLLSDLLRASLDASHFFTTVQDELDFVKNYIKIEELRYEYSFDTKWEIAENTRQLNTLRLILQPIVENAFIHGIHRLPQDIKGELTIRTEISDGDLLFYVIDNGKTPENQLVAVQANLDNSESVYSSKHVGLHNIDNRIKLLFGENYGCSIERQDDKTVVKVKVPVINLSI